MKNFKNLAATTLSTFLLVSCGQNSHMTLDAVTGPTDTTAPTASISGGPGSATNTALQSFTVTFSEAILGSSLGAGDFAVTNGVLSNLSCLPNMTAPTSCTFDVTASADGTVSVELPDGVLTDAAGNGNDQSNLISWSYDNTAPTVSIAVAAGEPTSGSSTNDSSISLELTASEAISGLIPSDFTCTNCTVSGISGSGTNYTLNVIPSGVGAVSVQLAATSVVDAAGNANTAASNSLNWDYNNVSPALTLAPSAGEPASGSSTNDASIAVELTSSAAITGLVSGDITCTNCTIGGFSGSGDTYTFNVIPSGSGAVSVNIPSGVAQDAATNQNTASNTLNWTYDNTAPTATLAVGGGGAASGSTTNQASIPITVTTSESVTGLASGDFTCTNCTIGSFSGSGANYTFNVIPTASGAVSVQLPASSALDAAGNGNTISNSLAWTFDNTAPTVVLSGAPSGGYGNTAQTITATFSEAMNTGTLSSSDVSVTNGAVSGFSCSGSPTACTFTVTPTSQGTVTIAMSGSVAQDNAGNNNTSASNISWVHDTVAPTVVISSTAASPTSTSPIPIEATWSELIDMPTLVAGDFTVANGSVDGGSLSCSNLPLVTPTYTKCSMTITPTANGAVTVDMAANQATDLAGNNNSAATQFSITYSAGTAPSTTGAEQCHSVAVDTSGNVYCGGVTTSSLAEPIGSSGYSDFMVVKFNSDGDIQWIRQAGSGYTGAQLDSLYSGSGGGSTFYDENCFGIAVDLSGNVFCAGSTAGHLGEQSGGDHDFFISKFDSNGELLWLKQAGLGATRGQIETANSILGGGGTGGYDSCQSITVDTAGFVYCAGHTTSDLGERNANSGMSVRDFFITKFTTDGDLVWISQAGDYNAGGLGSALYNSYASNLEYDDVCNSVAVDSGGNVICAGNSRSGIENGKYDTGSDDLFIVKLDANGSLLWARQAVGSAVSGGLHNDILAAYSGNGAAAPTGDDFCYSVAVDSVDNIYCGGKTSSSLLETHGNGGVYSDIFIVKLDSNGLLQGGFQPGLHSQGTPPCGDGDFDGFDDCDPSGSYIPAGTFQTQFESATAAFGGGETYYEQSCLSILVDSSTNIYCAGETEYSFGEQSNAGTSDDIFIMKFDSALNLSWVRQFGNNYSYNQLNSFAASNGGGSTGSSEKCAGIATDNSGSVVCAGWTEGGSLAEEIGGSIDLVVIKMDSAGDLVWSRQAGAQGRYTTNQIPSF